MLTRLCFAALSALLLHACSEGTCGPTRVENLETGRCDCRSEYVEVDMICILRTEFDGGPDVGIDAPEFDGGPGTDGCTETTLYRDRDRDGRGDPDDSIVACSDPQYVDNADDCDDTCNVCWTGAEEVCDTVDNDCDGFSDEGLTVPVGDRIQLTSDSITTSSRNRIAAVPLDDGGAIVFVVDASTPDGAIRQGVVVGIRFMSDGSFEAPFVVDDADDGPHDGVNATRVGDRVIVAYGTESNNSLRARAFDASTLAPATPATSITNADEGGSHVSLFPLGTSVYFLYEGTGRTLQATLRRPSLDFASADTIHTFEDTGFVPRRMALLPDHEDESAFWVFITDTIDGTRGVYGVRVDALAGAGEWQLYQAQETLAGFGARVGDESHLIFRAEYEDDSSQIVLDTLRLSDDGFDVLSTEVIDDSLGLYYGTQITQSGPVALAVERGLIGGDMGLFVYSERGGAWNSSLVSTDEAFILFALPSNDAMFFDALAPDGSRQVFARQFACSEDD